MQGKGATEIGKLLVAKTFATIAGSKGIGKFYLGPTSVNQGIEEENVISVAIKATKEKIVQRVNKLLHQEKMRMGNSLGKLQVGLQGDHQEDLQEDHREDYHQEDHLQEDHLQEDHLQEGHQEERLKDPQSEKQIFRPRFLKNLQILMMILGEEMNTKVSNYLGTFTNLSLQNYFFYVGFEFSCSNFCQLAERSWQ